jgi:hypothetical protein
MAQQFDIKFIASLEDRASNQLSQLQGKLKGLEPAFSTMAIAGTAGFAAITAAIGSSIKESIEYESVSNRLTHILKTSRGATDAQVTALLEQAEAMEKVGVVASDSIIQAQAQLATFDLEAESIQRLIPAILDYAVAERGASLTTEDLKGLTNGLAQALQGNFASLTKTGFVLDDATKAMIENGTEAERTAALVSVLNSTYEGFNKSARETAEGSLIVLRNEFNNLKQTIGDQFIPILNDLLLIVKPWIEQLAVWIQQNPELTKQILIAGLAVTGLTAVIGALGLAVMAFNPVVAGIVLAIAGFVWWINNLNEIIKIFKTDSEAVWAGIKIIFKEAVDWIIDHTLRPLMDWVDKVVAAINRVKNAVSSVAGKATSSVSNTLKKIIPFAEGGIVTRPTLGMVGEAGPEAIIPLSKMGRMGGGVTINIGGNTFMSDREAAEKIGDMIIRNLPLKLA